MKKKSIKKEYSFLIKTLIQTMRLCLLLFFIGVGSSFAETYSQNTRLSLHLQDVRLGELFSEIEKNSEYIFLYKENVPTDAKVTIHVENETLDQILKKTLTSKGVIYYINDRQVVVAGGHKEKGVLPQMIAAEILQKKIISGTITDKLGESIIGANVIEKGTTNGVITDIDGNFSLQVEENAVIQISYIGYVPQEIPVGNKNNLTVILAEDYQNLDEVVVVGYGTQKKVTLTGSVAAIGGDEIITTKNENVENMLAGKMPGVRVVQWSGEPGAFNSKFEIRGMGNPLIIIDGVPRENMNRLDPNEIESISVLKDASAAIYGVRAANGVVLITTKKGKSGKLQLDYSGSVGWQQASGLPETANAWQYMTLMNENARNNGRPLMYSLEEVEAYRNGTKASTNWAKVAIDEFAPQTQHSFSAQGNTEKIDYFVNFGYLNQDGFWKSGDLNYERYNIRSNVDAQLTKRLKAEVSLNGMMDTKNQPYRDTWIVYKSIWTQVPLWPVYANDNPDYLYNAADADHPLVITNSDLDGYRRHNSKLFQATMSLQYDVPYIDGLTAKAMYSYDYNLWESKEFSKEYTLYTYDAANDKYNANKAQSPSAVRRSFRDNDATLLQLSLNYVRTFNEKHNVNVLALYEESTSDMDNFYARRQLSMDAVDQLFAGNSVNQEGSMDANGFRSDKKLHEQNGVWEIANKGLVGRLNYDYMSKYIAEFSFRYDGSSKFAPGHQWGFFPAGSIGWRISEESFIKNASALSFVNNIKLRASYGKMGDDSSSSYQFLSGYNYPSGGYVFNDSYTNGLGLRGMANPYITWFTSKLLNVGLDADLWSGLLGFQFDVFERRRDGLLATRSESLPGTVGAGLPQENLEGDLTRGFELAITHRNRINDFNYFFSGNIAYARKKWRQKEISQRGNSYRDWRDNYTNRLDEMWWGQGYLGQFTSYDQIFSSPVQDNKGNSVLLPGDYMYEDWNGDGIIDDNDLHPISIKGLPKVNFGFTFGADYKGFDLNLLFQGAAQSYVRYPEQLERPLYWDRNGLSMFMNRWHLEDPAADPRDLNSKWIAGRYPSANNGETTNFNDSKRLIQDAKYLRLKSVEVGYSVPKKIINDLGVSNLRIYFSGYNLLTFTGIKYLDPEHPSETYGYLYPLTKSYNIGVNVSF